MRIKTITELTSKLNDAGVEYTVKSTGYLLQYKTVSYTRNGTAYHCDFHRGGKLIGIWG